MSEYKFSPFLNILLLISLFLIARFPEIEAKQRSSNKKNINRVSLLTYSPGQELYSVFGHSAIRVYNRYEKTDWVYNYGTFDFNTPDFYARFLKGKLIYSLSRAPYISVCQQMQVENRYLIETPLNLVPKEKSILISILEENLLPENKEYYYDFLKDNCSTRILDVLTAAINEPITVHQEAIPNLTYRNLLHPYLERYPWHHIGIDLLMGMPADREAESIQTAFLPDYLHLILKNAVIEREGYKVRKMSKSDIFHFNLAKRDTRTGIPPRYILWALVLFFILVSVFGWSRFYLFRFIDFIMFICVGSIGFLLIFAWISSDHTIFNMNADILWANPLSLIVAFLPFNMKLQHQHYGQLIFLYLTGILLLLGLVTTYFIENNIDLTAIALLVLIRLVDKIYRLS